MQAEDLLVTYAEADAAGYSPIWRVDGFAAIRLADLPLMMVDTAGANWWLARATHVDRRAAFAPRWAVELHTNLSKRGLTGETIAVVLRLFIAKPHLVDALDSVIRLDGVASVDAFLEAQDPELVGLLRAQKPGY